MGPRGGGGYGFLHLIGGMVGMALCLAVLLGLALLAWKIAKRKGWVSPGRGPHHEAGAPHPSHPEHGPVSALRILDERLARGEIEVDDYRVRRDALLSGGYPPFQQPPAAPPAPDSPPPA